MDDPHLQTRARAVLGSRHEVSALGIVSPAGRRWAVLGADPSADFEIGSVSKGVTGLLYADALARGEVSDETRLGDLLPVGETPVAAVTLGSLSRHSSGLPRLPSAMSPWRRTLALWRHGTNPYGDTLDELVAQARTVTVGKPAPSYSNLGFELLGHAVATAAGTTYQQLLQDRLVAPLGLGTFYAPAHPHELRPTALAGRSRRGRTQEPWTGEAIAPAGGIRSTVADLTTLVAALLDGTAPGLGALEPRHHFSRGVRIGAAWITLGTGDRTVTWHNGRTGGFAAWVGLDRPARTGVVLLSATAASLDRPGFRLLSAESPRS